MSLRVVIEAGAFGLLAAVLDGEDLIELREVGPSLPGQVADELFLARVTQVEPRLNAAFLDCGTGVPGFVTAKDARAGSGERRPIRELLREGERLLVQGLRDAADDKGPRFTSDVRLFGLALIHTPLSPRLDVSGRLPRRAADALRERAEALFPAGGFVLRRQAAELPDEALLAEAASLAERWRRVEAAERALARPGRIEAGESRLERLLRRVIELGPTLIEVADAGLWRELCRVQAESPAWPPELEIALLDKAGSAFAVTGVEAGIEEALAKDVPLPGGGRVRIEPTAALTAIDVDGSGRGPLDANLAAMPVIARQLRLRNLGGIIVIDAIDLERPADRKRVEEALRRALRDDPLPVEIHPGGALGLLVLSRARRGHPLAARWQRRCGACGGSGVAPSLEAQAERLLASLRERRAPPAGVRVAGDLAELLAGEDARAWREAAGRLVLGGWRADAGLPAGEFALDER